MNFKKILLATTVLFVLTMGIAFASTTSKITVNFENLKYIVQGKQIKPSDKTPGFIYNDSTYVPLRFLAEATGQEVGWDDKTKTITLKPTPQNSSQVEHGYQAEIDRLNEQIASLEAEVKHLKASGSTEEIVVSDKVTYKTVKKGNYTLNFTPTAFKEYSYLATEFDTITKEMFSYYGVKDISFPVKVYIQSKQDRVERPNSGAFYESGERIIVLNPDANFEMAGHDSVKFVFVHELSHSLQDATWNFETLHKVTNGEKNWILEGHADYIAKNLSGYTQYGSKTDPGGVERNQKYYYDEIQHRNGKQGWAPLNWESITTFQQLSLHRNEYFAFEAIVNFIAKQYSLEQYRILLEEMAKGKTGAEAIQTVFKKSDTQLMKEYKAFYKL